MLLNPHHWQPWIGPCISHILLIELYLNIHSSYSTQISLGYHIHCKYMHQIKSLRRAKGNKNPKYLACQNAQCCCGDACKSITTLQPQAATVQWSLSCHLPAPFPPYTACALVLRPLPNIMLLPWLTFLHWKVSGTSWAAAGGGNTVRQWYVCKCSYRADFVPWQSLSFNVIKIVPAALLGKYVTEWVLTMKQAPKADLYISSEVDFWGANFVLLHCIQGFYAWTLWDFRSITITIVATCLRGCPMRCGVHSYQHPPLPDWYITLGL